MEYTADTTDEPLVRTVTSVPADQLDEVFADNDYVVAFAGYRVKAELDPAPPGA
jgi:hypothetical protein